MTVIGHRDVSFASACSCLAENDKEILVATNMEHVLCYGGLKSLVSLLASEFEWEVVPSFQESVYEYAHSKLGIFIILDGWKMGSERFMGSKRFTWRFMISSHAIIDCFKSIFSLKFGFLIDSW